MEFNNLEIYVMRIKQQKTWFAEGIIDYYHEWDISEKSLLSLGSVIVRKLKDLESAS